MSAKCTRQRKDGKPCQAWAVVGSAPPTCAPHGGGKPVGAPPGNHNAQAHGYYSRPTDPPETIDDVITGVSHKLALLDAYIKDHKDDTDAETIIKLVNLYGQSASRLGRLYRDRKALGGAGDELDAALDQVLNELSEEWGVEL